MRLLLSALAVSGLVYAGTTMTHVAAKDTMPTTKEKVMVEDNTENYERSDEAIANLTDKQKYVTLHDGTEKPFENEYWDHKEAGIYVDQLSGEPLFSSTDKFDSGTGWPSFTKPINDNFITKHEDRKLFMMRTEVRSKQGDAHLGHVFNDGPAEHGGLRYCINSASLKFIPAADLEAEGYGKYAVLFEE